MTFSIKNVVLKYILDQKIKKKLFITYFVLIIIPLLIFSLIAYHKIAQTIQNNTMFSVKQSFDQAVFSFSSRVENAKNMSDLIILDAEATRAFNKMIVPNEEIPHQINDYTYLSRLFTYLQRNADVFHIRLFIPDNLMYSGDGQNFFSLETAYDKKWYEDLLNKSVNILWYPTTSVTIDSSGKTIKERVLSALRLVKKPNDYTKNIAILSIDILESDIHSMLKKAADLTETGIVYIENNEGIIQSSTSLAITANWRVPEKYSNTLHEGDWQKIKINDEMAFVGYKNIEKTDLRIVSVVPLKEILTSSSHERNSLIILLLVMGALAYLLAYFISASSTKRIYNLVDTMRRVQKGDLSVTIPKDSRDEIGELAVNFNFMIKKINELIEEQYKSGQEVKEAELKLVQAEFKTLQAQINPHFLYNTLDLINWMAIKYNCPDIESLIYSLSRFYKLSLRKGADIVTIRDEVMHIQTYLQIQNYRFENCVQLELDVASIHSYRIPKITLHPLVENSIMHGIYKKSGSTGTIKISGKLENDHLVMYIEDDGVGMTEEQIERIFQHNDPDEQTEDLHGFGIRNVNERLKQHFGSSYGLTYRSTWGEGTTVEIRIPLQI
ncbi:histidine kinase [Paenibacillus marchantiophytorum]|uniref:histidine kinase n=1 Tax=Paenibacillus marchantiophytorum TaxID=1619310 RepID=A0ABQ1EWJ9_9BACL|nr:sensor histidine kinase [Paenibacillus marchantiophytorum]GFZ90429.1 histidine kinase [Paenibacillus marchantiophytorum]